MPVVDDVIKPLKRGGSGTGYVEHYFGQHCDSDNLVTVVAPILGRVTFHKRVADALVAVLTEIDRAGMAQLIDRADYGGTYCCRAVRGSTAWSPHSWAIGIDLNVHHVFRDGREQRVAESNFHCRRDEIAPSVKTLATFFNAWGFSWGGHWNTAYIDPMHYEATELTIQKLAGGAGPGIHQEKPYLVQRADSNVSCEVRMENGILIGPVRQIAAVCGYETVADHLKDQHKAYVVEGG